VSLAIPPNAIGNWRIVETDPRDAQYLNRLKPAGDAQNWQFFRSLLERFRFS
jgi:hypothetical protein